MLTIKSVMVTGPDGPTDRGRGHPPYIPAPIERQIVEVMVSIGATQEAICRELVRRGAPCKSIDTLRRAFPDELAHGKERRITGYAVKMHSLAMGENPSVSFAACKYLLATSGDPRWRQPKDSEDATAELGGEQRRRRVFIPAVVPEAEENGPIIDGEVSEA